MSCEGFKCQFEEISKDKAKIIIHNAKIRIEQLITDGLINKDSVIYPIEIRDNERMMMCKLCKSWYLEPREAK